MKVFSPARLREARKSLKVTQTTLAYRAGIAQSVLSEYETGAVTPRLPNIERLALVLGIRVEDLMEEAK